MDLVNEDSDRCQDAEATHIWVAETFEALPSNTRIALHDRGQTKGYPKDTNLHAAHTPPKHVHLVLEGWVKLSAETRDGQTIVYDVIGPGGVLGEQGLIESTPNRYNAVAVSNVKTLSWECQDLKTLFKDWPELSAAFLQIAMFKQTQYMKQLEHRDVKTAPQRIGCFLLSLSRHSRASKTAFLLPYDKALIAARLGMKPETFSRALNKLCQVADVEISGSSVEIKDIKKLSDYVCAACASTFPGE